MEKIGFRIRPGLFLQIGFLGIAFLLVASSVFASSISDVVDKYCQLDSQGYRLSSDKYQKVLSLMVPDENRVEPGWDCVDVISAYTIENESHEGGSAKITVEYNVVGFTCQFVHFEQKEYKDLAEFDLLPIDGSWKIKTYVRSPRISIETAITLFRDKINELNKRGRETAQEVIKIEKIIDKLEVIQIVGSATVTETNLVETATNIARKKGMSMENCEVTVKEAGNEVIVEFLPKSLRQLGGGGRVHFSSDRETFIYKKIELWQ